MFAVVYKFQLKPANEDEVHIIVSGILDQLKGAKGLVNVVIYRDKETNEWGRTTIWETKEDSVAYGDSVKSTEGHSRSMELVDGELERKEYEVVGYATVD